ncbi:MAG: hypothetical protein ACR652_25695 [Methylocystis sp.]|uniref:hypothetical protein n=1 Tax=Methylocystis sp. TaxID=1911079 RepID=UPI003DA39A03
MMIRLSNVIVIDSNTEGLTHRIDLTPTKHGRANMFYRGEHIGVSSEPLFASARWLLKNGKADAMDAVETYRGSTMSMRAEVGIAAGKAVEEGDHGLRFRNYKPPPSHGRSRPMREAA